MVIPVNAVLPDSTLTPMEAAAKFQSTSLAGYGLRRLGMLRGLGGLGQDPLTDALENGTAAIDTSGNLIDTSTGDILDTGVALPTSNNANYSGIIDLGTTPTPAAVAAAQSAGIALPASGNSAAMAAFYAQLVKSGFSLAQLATIQPGTVVSPTGQVSRQASGVPLNTAQLTAGQATLTGNINSGTFLTLGFVGLLAVLLLKGRGNG